MTGHVGKWGQFTDGVGVQAFYGEALTVYTCLTCGAAVVEPRVTPRINARGLHEEWHSEQDANGSTYGADQ